MNLQPLERESMAVKRCQLKLDSASFYVTKLRGLFLTWMLSTERLVDAEIGFHGDILI